jgi:hypothetical protein
MKRGIALVTVNPRTAKVGKVAELKKGRKLP